MAIEKLSEFAKDGQKNTDDLNLTDGFPVSKKPARQWFNWLFNTLTSKVNEIIDADFIPKADIVNNLTTDDASKPVSAKQAKNLQDNKLDKTANAVSSSKLETVRTVSFSGAATGSFSYDGSSNSSAILTLANSGVTANTYGASLKIPIITVNAKGLITGVSEQNIPIVDNLTTDDASKPLSAAQGKILNDQKLNKDENAVGIKPIDNCILKPSEISLGVQAYFATLNSDNSGYFCDFLSLNGWHDASGGLKNALVLSKTGQSLHHYQAEYASQTWTIKKQIAYIDDNVASASKLKTPRNIALAGAVSGNVDFDGSGNITINTQLKENTAVVRAFCSFNGTGAPVILAESNIASISVSSLKFKVTFKTPMPHADYVINGFASDVNNSNRVAAITMNPDMIPSKTVNGFDFYARYSSNASTNIASPLICFSIVC